MVDESNNYVYLLESDPAATVAAVRRWQVLVGALLFLVCLAAVVGSLTELQVPLSRLLTFSLVALLLVACIVHFIVPRCVKKVHVTIGGDFITAPTLTSPNAAAAARYKDVVCVSLDLSKDTIVGATIFAQGLGFSVRRVKDPAIAVRAILERATDKVKWRRSWRPFRKLSREDVRTLIEKTQAPDIDPLLPPSAAWARFEDLFSRDKSDQRGVLARLFTRRPARSVNVLSLHTPTHARRYIHFMLLRMFEDGTGVRTLRRSEPLPTVTLGTDTAEPPAFEDVLEELKTLCSLDLRPACAPAGTMRVTIQGTPCEISCRFDDRADECCEIRLRRMPG